MALLTLVSSRNDHHCPQLSHGPRINENPACLAPVAPSPSLAALGHSPWPSSQHPANWDEPNSECWWVDGIAPLLLTFTVWQWPFCLTGPAAWVSAKLGACLLFWVSLLLPRADSFPDRPWYSSQDSLSLDSFSRTRTRNTCGHWNMPRLHLHLGPPWAHVVLREHHLPDGAAAGAGFPGPPVTSRLGPTFASFSSSWHSQFRAISLNLLFLLHSFLFPPLLPSWAHHSCSLRFLQWPPHHSRPCLFYPLPF